jgi:hypothetical protein
MKHLLALLVAAAFITPVMADDAPKTKEVCKDVKGKDGKVVNGKDGKPKQTCKTIKVHKKYEGTAIPEDKKKK